MWADSADRNYSLFWLHIVFIPQKPPNQRAFCNKTPVQVVTGSKTSYSEPAAKHVHTIWPRGLPWVVRFAIYLFRWPARYGDVLDRASLLSANGKGYGNMPESGAGGGGFGALARSETGSVRHVSFEWRGVKAVDVSDKRGGQSTLLKLSPARFAERSRCSLQACSAILSLGRLNRN